MGQNLGPTIGPAGKKTVIDTQRSAEILKLRVEGMALAEIGERVGLSPNAVSLNIQRSLKALKREHAEEYLALELARCDALLQEAMQTVRAFHPLISQGGVVMIPLLDLDRNPILNPQGEPMMTVAEDKAPRLAAIATAIKIIERQSKFLGLDAPTKSSTAVTVRDDSPSSYDYSKLSDEELDQMEALLNKAAVAPTTRAPAAQRDAVAGQALLMLGDGIIDAEIVDGEDSDIESDIEGE